MEISTLTLEQLYDSIEDGGWTLDEELHILLQNRALELDTEGVGLGPDNFWFEPQNYLTPGQLANLVDDTFMEQEGGGQPEFDINKHVTISNQYKQRVKLFKTTGQSCSVQFKNMDKVVDVQSFAKQAITAVSDKCLEGVGPSARVGMEIRHPGLSYSILVPFDRRDKLNADTIAQKVEDVLNSNAAFSFDEQMTWKFTTVDDTAGAGPDESENLDILARVLDDDELGQIIQEGNDEGIAAMVKQMNDIEEEENEEKKTYRRHKYRSNLVAWIKQKSSGNGNSLIEIKNKDQLCLARALVTAKAHEEFKRVRADPHASEYDKIRTRRNWNNIRRGDNYRNVQQRKQAQELMKEAGLENHQGPCGLAELKLLHQQLPGVKINVVSSEIMFAYSYSEGSGRVLNILHFDNHFYVITTLPGFFETNYYCEVCKKGYTRKQSHVGCGHRCRCCFNIGSCDLEQWIYCKDCLRWFLSQKCFDKHKATKIKTIKKDNKVRVVESSTCASIKRCEGCDKTLHKWTNYSHKHECGKRACKFCHENVDVSSHLCHIQQVTKPPKPLVADKKVPSFIYFDTETSQDLVIGVDKHGEIKQHQVNCVCYKKVCDLCYEDQSTDQCKNCNQPKTGQFIGDDSFDKFCEWLISEKNEGCYVLAHNARGFDGQFLLNWMQKKGFPPDNVMMRGLEIISMDFSHIKMLDSLNFLPFPLSTFPKTMGFDAAKGTFPYLFNKKENMDYRGPLPAREYYGTKTMKPKQLADFEKWYEAELALGKEFVLKDALLSYCHLDVDILTQGCMKMRKLVMEEHDVDPFMCSSTIASLCMYIYRKRFLKPMTIGIVPNEGYRKKEKHSVIAMKWLKLISKKYNLDIQHARNGGEAKILNYKVDGLLRGGKEVFEFYGCIYHGCPECFPNPNQELPMTTLTSGEAFQRTKTRHEQLEKAGYKVNFIWECKFHKQLKDNPDQAEEVKQMDVPEPMGPREAFFGGRTNCRNMYYKCQPGEKINYDDICSLYPFICKYGTFPVGHPDIITENFEPIDNRSYHGIIKARVLVPPDLLHPVLPFKSKGKLLFPNCRTCAETRNDNNCGHSEEERAFVGAWPSCEIYKAMDLGCQVLDLIEIYHYDQWSQYDKKDDETGLFTEYINSNLKKKQQASGWPAWIKTEDDKAKYIRHYEERENIKLDMDSIEKNDGMRALAKLMLNSFWGKFGQRSGLLTTKYFTSPDAYFDLVFDPSVEVHSIQIISDCMVCVTYKNIEEFIEDAPNTNVIIASWVTAQARLELYSYLEQLGDRVLYMDTDSVIYVSRPGDSYKPHLGDYLGDMTDELDGGYITEFVSLGPKQYAYSKMSPTGETTTECKIRGFTLNNVNVNLLNFYSMKRTALRYLKDRSQEPIVVSASCLRRTKDRTIVTKMIVKTYSVVYDKCRVLPSGQTVPFGYNV